MACLLCQKDLELRKSHIISKFIYKPLKKLEGNMWVLSEDPDQKNRSVQDGVKEYILCDECEGKRSKWESYFSNKWYNGDFLAEGESYRVECLDYAKTKLFFLSTLLLASVSNNPLFKEIELSPESFKRLRKMVDSGNPGAPHEYGCIFNLLVEDGIDTKNLVGSAVTIKYGEARIHRFLFGGFLFAIVEANGVALDQDFQDAFLSDDGSVLVRTKRVRDLAYLMDTFRVLKDQRKLDP